MINNSTGLAALHDLSPSDLPDLAYVVVYAMSLIFKIIVSLLLVMYLGLH